MSAQEKPRVKDEDDDNFFAHGDTSMLMSWLLSTSLTKKKLYFVLSLLCWFLQTALLALDVMFHFNIKSYPFLTYRDTEAILVLQVVNFYWSVLATFYAMQGGNRKLGYMCLMSAFLNLCVFAGRCGYEFLMMQFRAEEF